MGIPMIAAAASAGSSIFAGIQGYQAAKGQQQQAKVNAHIGRTRALQSDTVAREGLSDDLATMRTTLAGMGQTPGMGTFEVMQEMRRVKNRDRRIEYGSRMQESADWRMRGKNAGSQATGALLGGFINAGPSLFSLHDLWGKR